MGQNYPNSEQSLPKPQHFDEMFSIVRKLAANKKGFIRVGLYNITGGKFLERKPES